MNKFIYLALSLVSLLSFASCKDDDEKEEQQNIPNTPVPNESVTEPEKITDPVKIIASGRVNVEDLHLIGLTGGTPVDLGLSVKWATHNVGATECYDDGDYFAWGETKSKELYSYDNCLTLGLFEELLSKNIIDKNGHLTPVNDAATANWGSKFRMPTREEYKELVDFCDWHRLTITVNSSPIKRIEGYYVKSKSNGNSIFFPATGYFDTNYHNSPLSYANYWCSTVDESNGIYAFCLYFNSNEKKTNFFKRELGLPVRAVEN